MNGPFSPLGIASRMALKNEIKTGIQEGVGGVIATVFLTVTFCAVGVVLAAGIHQFLDRMAELYNDREKGSGWEL